LSARLGGIAPKKKRLVRKAKILAD
jgi:hypothetical protein